MKHARYVWLAFACCSAVVLAAMGWISLTAWQLEQAESVAREQEAEALRKEAETRRQAAVEENVRLALWRIDTTLAPLLAQESARPYFAYRSFLTPDRAYARMFNNDRNGNETLIPSPLLADISPNILLYFQFEPDGRLTSPQVPLGGNRKLAVPEIANQDTVRQAEDELAALGKLVDRQKLLTLLPDHRPGPVQVVVSPLEQNKEQRLAQQVQRQNDLQQYGRGGVEYQQRSQAVRNSTMNAVAQQVQPQGQSPVQPQQADYGNLSQPTIGGGQFPNNPLLENTALLANPAPNSAGGNFFGANGNFAPNSFAANNGWLLTETDIGGVLMSPLWIDGRLILARRISVAGQEYIQGCVLDWPTIKESLLATIADLLPEADLQPAEMLHGEPRPRSLAALPVRLAPGAVHMDPPQWPAVPALSDALSLGAERSLSPILVSLGTAWVGVLLAAAAVAGLLAGVLRLSERRASFVSAVTHELRTPLTTFQMYAEMLAEGMVPDEQQQRQYLRTLRGESLRLTHLVENVLSYARLERGRVGGRIETLSLDELLAPVVERLAARAEQAGLELLVEAENGAGETLVRANPSAVEQVLFNLVDNAGKYAAAAASDRRLHLRLQPNGKTAELRLRDHGPGVSAAARRRLFHSFSKSAHEAAHTAPGVGLGLALSRRLARDMGGDLRLDPRSGDGACFVLSLPLA